MSTTLSSLNPLSYMGVKRLTPPNLTIQSDAPTISDIKNFDLGAMWIDTTAQNIYMLVNMDSGLATWQLLGGASDLITITMPDSTVVEPSAGNINFLNGSGISVTGSGASITFTATASPFVVQWSVITTATKTIVVNEGYFANRGAGVAFTLPAVCSVGDVFYLSAIDAGGWSIVQNAGQDIRLGNQISTTGAGGSLSSTAIGDSIFCVCSVANTSFVVISSMGNITVV
jgi:hypothetical protein